MRRKAALHRFRAALENGLETATMRSFRRRALERPMQTRFLGRLVLLALKG
jgi:hypothetical protein